MTEIDYRPKPWTPKAIPTIWVDQATGRGVTGDGAPVRPVIGERRQKPNLTDLLDTAAAYGANRIMLTGKRPEPVPGVKHWLYVQTPRWIPGSHWINAGPPTGRFSHESTGFKIEVRTAEEWFDDAPLTPAQAREAWETTAAVMRAADERARMFNSPAATGTNLWALSLPKNVNPVPVDPDIAAEIHATSGQHHYDHLVAGANFSRHEDCVPLIDPAKTKKIREFAYVDGRFMYAGVGRELGIGPARRLNREAASELLFQDPYARARFHVRFRVPENWHHVGLLPVKHQRVEEGWFYPNRPGAVHDTWVDGAELHVAQSAGWEIVPHEAVLFKKARPLDTFTDRMTRARAKVSENRDMNPTIRQAVMSALRSIMLHSIGAFAAGGRDETRVATSLREIPQAYQGDAVQQGKLYVYHVPSNPTSRTSQYYHPELAAQVWGRARARVLLGPSSIGGATSGALRVDPATLVGIQGDALFTTSLPIWSLPVDQGGGDDGKTGRLRLQGYTRGEYATPETLRQRAALKARAERAGLDEALRAIAEVA